MNPSLASTVTGLTCLICNSTFENGNLHTCPKCGVHGILDVQYDYDAVRARLSSATLAERPFDHWRYRELLPISAEAVIPHLAVGGTPLYNVPRLAAAVGTVSYTHLTLPTKRIV